MTGAGSYSGKWWTLHGKVKTVLHSLVLEILYSDSTSVAITDFKRVNIYDIYTYYVNTGKHATKQFMLYGIDNQFWSTTYCDID